MEPAELGGRLHGDTHGTAEESVDRVDPKHLALENRAEVAADGFGYGGEVERLAEFSLHRGDRFRGDSTGDDEVEVAEVGVDVEGEAVRRDEARDVDADGDEFGFGPTRLSG